jgi:5-methylcytosine-specific restriction endonuclease McrA
MRARTARTAKRSKKKPKVKRVKKKKEWRLERYLIPALRRIWRYYPIRRSVKSSCILPNGMIACNMCKLQFREENIQVDHIIPVGSLPKLESGKIDWNTYIERLLCVPENLQCLCESCHKDKTQRENQERKRAKKLLDPS